MHAYETEQTEKLAWTQRITF